MYQVITVQSQCPECDRIVIALKAFERASVAAGKKQIADRVIWPLGLGRGAVSRYVPRPIAQDYEEAALVLQLSPKASAALSRRCLQAVLTDPAAGAAKEGNLSKQIDEVADKLPSWIADNLHYVREIGNFAAHEQKSRVTGEILDVEAGEAEWNLEVLEALFDFFYVQRAKEEAKRKAMDAKIANAGRKPLP